VVAASSNDVEAAASYNRVAWAVASLLVLSVGDALAYNFQEVQSLVLLGLAFVEVVDQVLARGL